MAGRFAIFRIRPSSPCAMESFAARSGLRYFSERTTGRVLSEEERAAENVYIQKMERERMEKARRRAEQEKVSEGTKSAASASEKKAEGGA